MGNSQNRKKMNPDDPRFYDGLNLDNYRQRRPDLQESEIKQIWQVFHTFNPEQGEIQRKDLLNKYTDDPEWEVFKQ